MYFLPFCMNSSRIVVHFTGSRSKIWAPLALLTFYKITRYINTIDHYCCENCVVKKRLIAVNYNWVLILKLSGKKEHSIVIFRAPAGLQDSALKEKSQWGQMSLALTCLTFSLSKSNVKSEPVEIQVQCLTVDLNLLKLTYSPFISFHFILLFQI